MCSLDHENIVRHFLWFKEKEGKMINYNLVMDFESSGDLYDDLMKRTEKYSIAVI